MMKASKAYGCSVSCLPKSIAILFVLSWSLFSAAACNRLESEAQPTNSPAPTAPSATSIREETNLRLPTEALPPTQMVPATAAATEPPFTQEPQEIRPVETAPVSITVTPPRISTTDTPLPATPPPATPLAPAQLLSFEVTPSWSEPGESVTLNWNAIGAKATICPSARYILFTEDDCQAVPLTGTMAFVIPDEAEGMPSVDFLLTVEGSDSSLPITQQLSVALKCQLTWFFSNEPQAGICPTEPIWLYAAAQRFERGEMIWLERFGRYIILEEAPIDAGSDRKTVHYIYDPLEIIDDSSAEIHPPEGVYAPESGFGLVWRGDVRSSPGFRQSLGWALAPEFGYEAVFQCDNAPPSGGRSWQICYLKGPADEIITFHPLGGWAIWQGEG